MIAAKKEREYLLGAQSSLYIKNKKLIFLNYGGSQIGCSGICLTSLVVRVGVIILRIL